jgi:hypothetical protein
MSIQNKNCINVPSKLFFILVDIDAIFSLERKHYKLSTNLIEYVYLFLFLLKIMRSLARVLIFDFDFDFYFFN